MNRFISILTVFVLVSCAGIGVQISEDATTVLQKSAISTVGYLIAKNNPSHVDDMLAWYNIFQGQTNLADVQAVYKDGINKLSAMISNDPYLQLQVRNAMSLLEISVDGPQTDLGIGKYKEVVDSFMAGVVAAPRVV